MIKWGNRTEIILLDLINSNFRFDYVINPILLQYHVVCIRMENPAVTVYSTVQYVCTVYSRLCVVSVLSIYSTELLIAELLWLWSWWWWWCEGKSCSELSTENLYYSNWNKKQFLRIKMYWHILYYSRMTEMYALFELNM